MTIKEFIKKSQKKDNFLTIIYNTKKKHNLFFTILPKNIKKSFNKSFKEVYNTYTLSYLKTNTLQHTNKSWFKDQGYKIINFKAINNTVLNFHHL